MIEKLRTIEEKEINIFYYDLILFLIYLFSLIDLILTAYIQTLYPNSALELNPLYSFG